MDDRVRALLLAALVAVPLTATAEKAPLVLVARDWHQLVDRGGGVRFDVDVTNRGDSALDVRFTVAIRDVTRVYGHDERLCRNVGEPGCWMASFPPPPTGEACARDGDHLLCGLPAGTTTTVAFEVAAPSFEEPDASAIVDLVAVRNDTLAVIEQTGVVVEIRDYGVGIEPSAARVVILPAGRASLDLRIRNFGDGEDRVVLRVENVPPGWAAALAPPSLVLASRTSGNATLSVASPIDTLPPGGGALLAVAHSPKGDATGISTRHVATILLSVPVYRAGDVDDDGVLELALDLDEDDVNGFETFYERPAAGHATVAVASPLGRDGRATHLLATAGAGAPADRFWDPERQVLTAVLGTLDFDADGAPDHLLDTDGDEAVDAVHATTTGRLLDARPAEVTAGGDQLLVDADRDGVADRFVEASTGRVTALVGRADLGAGVLGVDTDGDGTEDAWWNATAWAPFDAPDGAPGGNVTGGEAPTSIPAAGFAALAAALVAAAARRRR